ncbi:MAG: hypothetical protein KDD61_17345 [Bdellovibrionales bacterium]|nr:hypothetical protein [Bdellovibrionales bacterium]
MWNTDSMCKKSSLIFACLLTFLIAFVPPKAEAQQSLAGKEFILSCTYGVLAGTLVGFASLAFTDQPGENLNRVARGASLGLYLGIALGAYVVYGVPNDYESEQQILQQPGYPEEEGGAPGSEETLYDQESRIRVQVFPLISQRGVEGIGTQIQLYTF